MPDDLQYRASGVGGLPKGSRTALDEAADFAAAAPGAPEDTTQEPIVASYAQGQDRDNLDAELFAPTDNPDRPLTHGAPTGPGANAVFAPRLSDRAMLARIGERMLANRDSLPESAVIWAVRAALGQ